MKEVRVRTRARTMSGQRGGRTLTLDKVEAERWIGRRWADPVETAPSEQVKTKRTAHERRR